MNEDVQAYIDTVRRDRDVAQERVVALVFALNELKQGTCWCEIGLGIQMARGHSRACKRVQELLGER